jgi:hypothetical protein
MSAYHPLPTTLDAEPDLISHRSLVGSRTLTRSPVYGHCAPPRTLAAQNRADSPIFCSRRSARFPVRPKGRRFIVPLGRAEALFFNENALAIGRHIRPRFSSLRPQRRCNIDVSIAVFNQSWGETP